MQLKFRQPIYNADGTFKEWHYWGFGVGIEDEFVTPHSGYRKAPSQQFTGMQDAKGEDIYRGDYVKMYSNGSLYAVVWMDTELCWGLHSINTGGFSSLKNRLVRIIGNDVEGIAF